MNNAPFNAKQHGSGQGPQWLLRELAARFEISTTSLKLIIRHDTTAPKGHPLVVTGGRRLYYDLKEMDKWWHNRIRKQ